MQTRLQEISQNRLSSEEEKRLFLRNELKTHNAHLASAAKQAGVISHLDYAIFQNHGYMGLYDGLDAKKLHKKRKLKKSQNILDHMGSTELAANLFRATQAEEKLKKDKIKGVKNANDTHYEIGKKVRQTIKEIGGEMPENLPIETNIRTIESKRKKELNSPSKKVKK
jgi:DNA-damage-inducible protein D